jgi:hypothetical protein
VLTGWLTLEHSRVVNCGADGSEAEGGGVHSSKSLVTMMNSVIGTCTTSSPDAARGGGIYVLGSWLEMTDCSVSHCTVTGMDHAEGGGVFSMTSSGSIINTTISYCRAAFHTFIMGGVFLDRRRLGHTAENEQAVGGGLYVQSGKMTLYNGTLFYRNEAARGDAIFPLAGYITYQLPAPPGHWLPFGMCIVYRKPCSVFGDVDNSAYKECISHTEECSLDPDGERHGACPGRGGRRDPNPAFWHVAFCTAG